MGSSAEMVGRRWSPVTAFSQEADGIIMTGRNCFSSAFLLLLFPKNESSYKLRFSWHESLFKSSLTNNVSVCYPSCKCIIQTSKKSSFRNRLKCHQSKGEFKIPHSVAALLNLPLFSAKNALCATNSSSIFHSSRAQ